MATTLAPFENGLMMTRKGHEVHLIHPRPVGLRPLCKPLLRNADAGAREVTHATEPTCADCIRINAEMAG